MWSFPSFSLEAVSQEQLKRAAAQGDGDELLDQRHLAEMLGRYSVTMLEVERMLYSEWQDMSA